MVLDVPEEKLLIAKRAFDAVITPEVLKEAEEVHKRLSKISIDEMFKPFTM